MKHIFLITLFNFLFWASASSQNGKLIIEIQNVQSQEGILKIALFAEDEKEHFVYRPGQASKRAFGKIENNTAYAVISDIPYGKYAISLFHDLNDDDELNRAALGYPTEPYGFSNNPPGLTIPPYEDAMFEINDKEQKLIIELKNFSISR